MQKLSIKAEKRKIFGRKVKKLRKEGMLPANIYGKNVKSLAVKVDLADFIKVYEKAGETGLVEVMVGKQARPSLIHNVQLDPVSDQPLHIDFHKVNLKEKVTAAVPVEQVNESPAEKQGLGTVVQYLDEIEVEALPTDLPEKFATDLSVLDEVNKTITINDLKYDKKKISIDAEKDMIIFKVAPLRKEEEEPVPTPAEDVEGEEEALEGEEKPEEGESPPTEAPPDKEESKEV